MDSSTIAGKVGDVVADLDAVVDRLADLDPDGLDDAGLRGLLVDTSRVVDRLDAVRARAVGTAVTGGMVERDGGRSASGDHRPHLDADAAADRRRPRPRLPLPRL